MIKIRCDEGHPISVNVQCECGDHLEVYELLDDVMTVSPCNRCTFAWYPVEHEQPEVGATVLGWCLSFDGYKAEMVRYVGDGEWMHGEDEVCVAFWGEVTSPIGDDR